MSHDKVVLHSLALKVGNCLPFKILLRGSEWQTNARVGGVFITIWAAELIDADGHHLIRGAKFITL